MAVRRWCRPGRMCGGYSRSKTCLSQHCPAVLLIVATVLGFGLGVLHQRLDPPSKEVTRLVGFPGVLLIRAFRLLLVPLVTCSLVLGISSLRKRGGDAKLVAVTITFFVILSLLSAVLGVVVGYLTTNSVTTRGHHEIVNSTREDGTPVHQGLLLDSALDLLRNAVPDNIVQATFMQEYTSSIAYDDYVEYTTDNVTNFTIIKRFDKVTQFKYSVNFVGLLVCCIFIGCAMALLENEVSQLSDIISQTNLVITKILGWLIRILPIGLFFWMYQQGLEVQTGGEIFRKVGFFWGIATLCMVLQQMALLPILYLIIVRKNPFAFHVKLLPAILIAFGSSSSAVALPVTLKCMETSHVRYSVTSFVVPFGVVVHMIGGTFYISMVTVFVAALEGVILTPVQYVIVCFVVFLLLVAAPAMPNSGSPVIFLACLSSVGIEGPMHLYLVLVMDWLMERIRTSNNVVGDCYVSAFVDKLCCSGETRKDNPELEDIQVDTEKAKVDLDTRENNIHDIQDNILDTTRL